MWLAMASHPRPSPHLPTLVILQYVYLSILVATQPRWPVRAAAFMVYVCILGLVFTCTTGVASTDYGLACMLAGQFILAIQFILLQNPLRELRHERDHVAPEKLPFWRRTYWALCVLFSSRGIGWTYQIPHLLPRPSTPRREFAYQQVVKAVWWYLIVDLGRAYQHSNRLFFRDAADLFGEGFPGYLHRCVNIVAFLGPMISITGVMYCLIAAVFVTLGWSPPRDWPHVYGNWADSYTVRRFWGRTYHQNFRRCTAAVGKGCCRLLGLKPGSWASSYTQLYVGFATSGFMHCVGDLVVNPMLFGTSFPFFIAQAVAISLEDAAIGVARRIGLQSRYPAHLWRMLGYAWVVLWFSVSAPWFIAASLRVGALSPVSFSLIAMLSSRMEHVLRNQLLLAIAVTKLQPAEM